MTQKNKTAKAREPLKRSFLKKNLLPIWFVLAVLAFSIIGIFASMNLILIGITDGSLLRTFLGFLVLNLNLLLLLLQKYELKMRRNVLGRIL